MTYQLQQLIVETEHKRQELVEFINDFPPEQFTPSVKRLLHRILNKYEMFLDRWWQKNNAARRRHDNRNIHETISNEH